MSFEIEASAKYSRTHEWARIDGDTVTCGVTKYAPILQTDAIYVMLPDIGSHFRREESFGTIESTNAVTDVLMPLSGTIIEINNNLDIAPQTLNQDPYRDGWIIKIKPDDLSGLEKLMNAQEYEDWLYMETFLSMTKHEENDSDDEHIPSPEDMIGSIEWGRRVESIEAIGAEQVVFNLLNLDTGEIDMVLKVNRSKFDPERVLFDRLRVASENIETDPDRVIRICDKILQFSPGNAAASYYKAVAMTIKGELEQSLEWFDVAIASEPTELIFWILKSYTLSKINKHQESVEHLLTAISLDPGKVKDFIIKIDTEERIIYQSLNYVLKHNPNNKQVETAIIELYNN